jgi:hypothetical protein
VTGHASAVEPAPNIPYKIYEDLLESKKEEIARVEKSKVSEIARVEKSKEETIKSKESEIATLKEFIETLEKDRAKAEAEALVAKNEKYAVMDTRVLLQIAGAAVHPGMSPTKAIRKLAASVKQNNSVDAMTLCADSMVRYKALLGKEEAMEATHLQTVCNDLKSLYHQFSKEGAHVLRNQQTPGCYIGHKDKSLRVCAALVISKAQEVGQWPSEVGPIFFLDDKSDAQFELRGGSVLPLPSPAAT